MTTDNTITRDFKVTLLSRIRRDPDFVQGMIEEAENCIQNGEIEVGESMLRDLEECDS
jgi:hypothetical protein